MELKRNTLRQHADNSADTTQVNEAVAEAVRKRAVSVPESAEDALKRIGGTKLTDKEREAYAAFCDAYTKGDAKAPEKWTKTAVVVAGQALLRERELADRQRKITEVIASKPPGYHILTHDSELPAFVNRIREECRRQMAEWNGRFRILGVETMTAGDYEGSGVDTYIDVSIGFSIWLPLLGEGYYVPYGHVDVRGAESYADLTDEAAFKTGDPQCTRSAVIAAISPYMQRPEHGKTFHMGSARYDLHVAIKDGYEIGGCVWDTLDAMRHLNEHEPLYGLKPLIAKYGRYFGLPGPIFTFDDLFGARSPAPFNTEVVGIYAINDVKYGWKLFEWQFEAMKNAPSAKGTGRLLDCYARIDSKLPETDVFLARCGFEIDTDGLKRLEAEFKPKLAKAIADVTESYGIDSAFIRKMDRTIHAKKVADWVAAQEKKIARHAESLARNQAVVAKCERPGRTSTKKYTEACAKVAELLADTPAPATEEYAPLFTEEFTLTNGNHLAYLIYDHLAIEDATPRIKRGKVRATSADVMEIYYDEEEALKPLATVAALEKLLNTYIGPMLGSNDVDSIVEVDGRIHSEFKAGGTSTGRYSSSGYTCRPVDILSEFEVVAD
jgi:DNA polymerase-1